jgi:hypothetical protein
MKIYYIDFKATLTTTYVVEASDADHAYDKAWEAFDEGFKPVKDVADQQAFDVQETKVTNEQ